MYFTKGPLREYERIMREKPRYDYRDVKKAEERDCKHCLCFDKSRGSCGREKCILSDD